MVVVLVSPPVDAQEGQGVLGGKLQEGRGCGRQYTTDELSACK